MIRETRSVRPVGYQSAAGSMITCATTTGAPPAEPIASTNTPTISAPIAPCISRSIDLPTRRHDGRIHSAMVPFWLPAGGWTSLIVGIAIVISDETRGALAAATADVVQLHEVGVRP